MTAKLRIVGPTRAMAAAELVCMVEGIGAIQDLDDQLGLGTDAQLAIEDVLTVADSIAALTIEREALAGRLVRHGRARTSRLGGQCGPCVGGRPCLVKSDLIARMATLTERIAEQRDALRRIGGSR